jgi:hypothetical protein
MILLAVTGENILASAAKPDPSEGRPFFVVRPSHYSRCP